MSFLSKPPLKVQHLQSGDAKVTMARDGQDRVMLSPFDRKSRSAVAAFLGMKRWVFTGKNPPIIMSPIKTTTSRNIGFFEGLFTIGFPEQGRLLNLLIGYLGGPLKYIHISGPEVFWLEGVFFQMTWRVWEAIFFFIQIHRCERKICSVKISQFGLMFLDAKNWGLMTWRVFLYGRYGFKHRFPKSYLPKAKVLRCCPCERTVTLWMTNVWMLKKSGNFFGVGSTQTSTT